MKSRCFELQGTFERGPPEVSRGVFRTGILQKCVAYSRTCYQDIGICSKEY